MSYYTDQRAIRQQAAARKRERKQIAWLIMGFVAFVIVLGIVGHFEQQDLLLLSR